MSRFRSRNRRPSEKPIGSPHKRAFSWKQNNQVKRTNLLNEPIFLSSAKRGRKNLRANLRLDAAQLMRQTQSLVRSKVGSRSSFIGRTSG